MIALNAIRTSLVVLSIVPLSGCWQESFTDTNGETFILNKIAGNVFRLKGNQLVELPVVALSDFGPKSFTSMTITQDDLLRVGLSTKYENSSLLFRFIITPNDAGSEKETKESRRKEWQQVMRDAIQTNANGTFTVTLTDSYGFEIEHVSVSLDKLIGSSDSNGVWRYAYQGEQPIEPDKYLQLSDWEISYPRSVKKRLGGY
jgi:hypothetical protein